MDRLLYTAMSGAQLGVGRQAILSNNLANVGTAGFREQLSAARAVPVQGQALLSTRASAVETTVGSDLSVGPLSTTGRPLDVALREDNSWIAVQADDGTEAYTRRGDLQADEAGVLRIVGRPVLGDGGPIVVPLDSQVFVGADGTLSAIGPGEGPDTIADVGRLRLVAQGDAQMARGEDGFFRPVADQAGNVPALLRDENLGVISGTLEGSNVNPAEAMVAVIEASRYFELQMSAITTADENAERANRLLAIQ